MNWIKFATRPSPLLNLKVAYINHISLLDSTKLVFSKSIARVNGKFTFFITVYPLQNVHWF